jgi:hypothetical protein
MWHKNICICIVYIVPRTGVADTYLYFPQRGKVRQSHYAEEGAPYACLLHAPKRGGRAYSRTQRDTQYGPHMVGTDVQKTPKREAPQTGSQLTVLSANQLSNPLHVWATQTISVLYIVFEFASACAARWSANLGPAGAHVSVSYTVPHCVHRWFLRSRRTEHAHIAARCAVPCLECPAA